MALRSRTIAGNSSIQRSRFRWLDVVKEIETQLDGVHCENPSGIFPNGEASRIAARLASSKSYFVEEPYYAFRLSLSPRPLNVELDDVLPTYAALPTPEVCQPTNLVDNKYCAYQESTSTPQNVSISTRQHAATSWDLAVGATLTGHLPAGSTDQRSDVLARIHPASPNKRGSSAFRVVQRPWLNNSRSYFPCFASTASSTRVE